MSDTTFVSKQTNIPAAWCQDVNNWTYRGRDVSGIHLRNAKDPAYGAVGNGSTDDTAAIQAMLTAGGGFLPAGTYRVTGKLSLGEAGYLRGAGKGVTILKFDPTASGTCLEISNGSNIVDSASVADLSFYSADTTYTKVAIDIIDGGSVNVQRVSIYGPSTGGTLTWHGAGSIGVRIKGRQMLSFSDIDVSADKPWYIASNPHNLIALDHCNFHNIYAIAYGNPVWTVDFSSANAIISNSHWTGAQAWVRGTHGFYWSDTTSTVSSYGLTFSGIRTEQGESDNNYILYIAPPAGHSVYGVHVQSTYGGTESTGHERRGFYFRNANNVHLDNVIYTSASAEALNVDSSVIGIKSSESFWQAGCTATLSGQRWVQGTPYDPSTGGLPPNFILDASANSKATVLADVAYGSNSIALAKSGGITSILGANAIGVLTVVTNNGKSCSAYLAGGSVTIIGTPLGTWSNSLGTGASMNIGYGGGVYKIENQTAADLNIRWFLAGTLETF